MLPCPRVSNLVLFSIPAFLISIALEVWYARRHRELLGYSLPDTVASLSMGLLNVGISAFTKLLAFAWFAWLYEHRFANVDSCVVLFFAEDLCYYAFHRAHHEIRFLWAAHVNHHSSQRFNLSTALRQPLLTPLTGPLFWSPLALLGYPPWMIMTAQAWSLLYQFWIHTEVIQTLGPLEWILNTPSHHRVHHGKNIPYLDKNHAGILILWDRLFGTFAREETPVVYGLTHDIHTYNPLRIGFHEVAAIGRDVARAPTLGAKLGYVFAPPGWSHDGSSKTAKELQR